MNKITIVCLEEDRLQSLKKLGGLGSVHIVPVVQPHAESIDETRTRLGEVDRLVTLLKGMAITPERRQALTKMEPSFETHEAAYDWTRAAWAKMNETQAQLRALREQLELVEPWGNFDWKVLHDLEKEGFHWMMGDVVKGQAVKMPEDCFYEVVARIGRHAYFFAASMNSLEELENFRVSIPDGVTIKGLEKQIALIAADEYTAHENLEIAAVGLLEKIGAFRAELVEKLNFCQAYYGMGCEFSRLAFLQGYIPSDNLEALRKMAAENGWAVRFDDVVEDDHQVPTKLRIPKPFRMSRLIFDFIGVLPGYNEADASIAVLVFLSLFCGMLVGDAGYGALFTLATGIWWNKVPAGESKDAPKLLFIMSCCVLAWGAVSGNWFGIRIPADAAGIAKVFGGLPWLSHDASGDHVKFLCFFIGSFHLVLARIWSAMRSRKLTEKLGHVGWALFLWVNFYTVQMLIVGGAFGLFPKILYAVSTVLILLFAINWKDIGDVFYMPFQFINSLVDIMSYIRLYAVGLSGLYIAQSFNDMSAGLWNYSLWLIPVGIVVILIGHILNIALCCMSVMVHGVRLNTLEFSNHIGLEWGGRPYNPFHC